MKTTSLLPARESKRPHAIHIAMREEFERLFALAETQSEIADPMRCPAQYLAAHKIDREPPIWNENLPVWSKRILLRDAPVLRLLAGSFFVVVKALESFDLQARIENWSEVQGAGYATFRVVIDAIGSSYDDATIARMEALINAVKRLSAHLIEIQTQAAIDPLAIYHGAFVHFTEFLELNNG